jgi:hypothetical protein
MKKIMIIVLLTHLIQPIIFAENSDDFIMLYVYRSNSWGVIKYKVVIDNQIISSEFKKSSRISYKKFSQSITYVSVSCSSDERMNQMLTINTRIGNSYYIKIDAKYPAHTEILLMNNQAGKSEFDKAYDDGYVIEENKKETTLQINDNLNPSEETKKTTQQKKFNYSYQNDSTKEIIPIQSLVNSDVDSNIPETNMVSNLNFALIIGNEDYIKYQKDLNNEMNVDFANNDARVFKEYSIKTLGIPEKNIIFILDGTAGQINQGLSKLNLIAKNTNGKAKVYFY